MLLPFLQIVVIHCFTVINIKLCCDWLPFLWLCGRISISLRKLCWKTHISCLFWTWCKISADACACLFRVCKFSHQKCVKVRANLPRNICEGHLLLDSCLEFTLNAFHRYTAHYLCCFHWFDLFIFFFPSFGSKVKIMPRCHPPVCCLNQTFSCCFSITFFASHPTVIFTCPAALQSPTYPSPAASSPSRGPSQRPESYLFRLSQREDKKKGLHYALVQCLWIVIHIKLQ